MKRYLYILIAIATLAIFAEGRTIEHTSITNQENLILTESMPRSDLFRAGESTIALPTSEGSVTQQRTSQSVVRRVGNNLLTHKSSIESSQSSLNSTIVRSVVPVPSGDLMAKDYYIFQLRHIII
ncbi:MAG: hypothetical protein IKK02_05275 [Tidjanibacter sp.]|nr:hypothetical protein [Tidjanibacter sp.]